MRQLDILEKVQWRVCSTSPVGSGQKSWACAAWRTEGSGGDLINVYKYLKERAKKTKPGSFQWCPEPGQEGVGRNLME